MKKCPFCAEEVQDAAVVCRFCNRPLVSPKTTATGPGTVKVRSSAVSFIYILFAVIALVFVVSVFSAVKRSLTPTPEPVAAIPVAAATPPPPPHEHDSNATVSMTLAQISLTNTGSEPWIAARITVNPSGMLRRGYTVETGPMAPKRKVTAGLATLADADGKRFNPFQYKVQETSVRVTFKDGHTAYYTFK